MFRIIVQLPYELRRVPMVSQVHEGVAKIRASSVAAKVHRHVDEVEKSAPAFLLQKCDHIIAPPKMVQATDPDRSDLAQAARSRIGRRRDGLIILIEERVWNVNVNEGAKFNDLNLQVVVRFIAAVLYWFG